MTLYHLSDSIRARLNTSLFEQRFKPLRGKITASDIDLKLDQDGWSCVVEGKPIRYTQLKGKTTFEQLLAFHKGNFKGGQFYSFQDFESKGFMTCVAYLAYVLKEGYELIRHDCKDGSTFEGVKGPAGGKDFAHPFRHIPLAYFITVPHAELKKPAIEFLQSEYFRDCPEVKVLSSALVEDKFAVLFPLPTGDCGLSDLDNEKYGGCFFAISSHFGGKCKYNTFIQNGKKFD
jgi:hypothetical protein